MSGLYLFDRLVYGYLQLYLQLLQLSLRKGRDGHETLIGAVGPVGKGGFGAAHESSGDLRL